MEVIKKITAILLLLVGLLVVSSAALADDTAFDKVEIDDTEMTDTNVVYVERGSTIDVDVWYTAGTNHEDVKIKTWLGGYEYADVEDVTSMFDVEQDVTYHKTLTLELPNDMEASEDYTIYVQLYNKNSIYIDEEYTLRVKEERHKLAIQDVILRPSTVTAGNALFATIRVENMGYTKEENIKVTVSIPDLGVSTRMYIDELVPEEDTDDYNDDDETSASTDEMRLLIAEDAATGDYTVEVRVEYNRGHDTVETTDTIHVKSAEEAAGEVPRTIVSVDGLSKETLTGIESAFKVMVANLGEETAVYSAEVAGADLWATARVEPAMVTLTPDSTGEMYVYVKPKESAEAGKHSFTVKLKSGDKIVTEKTLTADVTVTGTASNPSGITGATTAQTNFASLKNALVIGFGVLVVLLVILGLIIAFNKMNKDEDEEVPTNEGQAYY